MDTLKPSGELTIRAYKFGRLIWEHTDHNLIVDVGYAALLSGLAGVANKSISKVQIGTDGTPPTPTDTELTSTIDLVITSYTVVNRVLTLNFEMGALVGNGTIFSEYGLICADGTLFSRRVVPAFTKIQDLTLEGVWKINI